MSASSQRLIALDAHREGPGGVILMDAECVLCNRFARFVIRHDPRGLFVLVPKKSAACQYLLADLGLTKPLPETIVLLQGGKVYLYSDVSFRVVGALAFPWSLARFLLLIPKFIRDPAYMLVSRNRYRLFGKTSPCGLLSPAERERVLWE